MPPLSFRLATAAVGFVLLYSAALYFGKTTVETDLSQRVNRTLAVADGSGAVQVSFDGRDATLVVQLDAESDTTHGTAAVLSGFPAMLAQRVSGVRTVRVHYTPSVPSAARTASRMPGDTASAREHRITEQRERIDPSASERLARVVAAQFDARRIRFATGTATLTLHAEAALDELAPLLRAEPRAHLRIEGHMDTHHRSANTVSLSKRRAEAVRAYLATQGVDALRLQAIGYGGMRPVASNATEAGRRENRRIAFVLPV